MLFVKIPPIISNTVNAKFRKKTVLRFLLYLYGCVCGYDYYSFVNLEIMTAAAVETFKDSALPLPGIVTNSSASDLIISEGPEDSLENDIIDFYWFYK